LFREKAFDSKKSELYQFTPIHKFTEGLEISAVSNKISNLENFIDERFINLIFLDGVLQEKPQNLPGIKILSIEESFKTIKDFFSLNNPLSEIHHALIQNGILIEVASKTELTKPLRILNLVTNSNLKVSTIVVRAGAFSKFSIIEEHIEQEISCLSIGETHIVGAEGSEIEHVQLSNLGLCDLNHTTTKSAVSKNGSYRNISLNLKGKLNRQNLEIDLNAPGAHGESYALYLTSGTEHSDINTSIEHRSPDTTSNQISKGILDGNSKGIFTGKIHIHPNAQRVSSGQLNKNLLLSQKAQAHSQPQLEIFADDVKCSHGSTTGQLSDDEVFYFEARGIPRNKAKTLLAMGFALEITHKIKTPLLKKYLDLRIKSFLSTKFNIGNIL
jgi:FeS assembly protein SufD